MNSKKVIMLLTNSFNPDVRVLKEALFLIKRGFRVEILCWDKDSTSDKPILENVDGINIKRFKISSIAGSGKKQVPAYLKYISTIKRELKTNRCDYLHCNDLDGALAGYLAKLKDTPMVFDMHEYYEHGNVLQRFMIRNLVIFLLKKSIAGLYENAIYLAKPYKSVHSKLLPLRNYPDSSLIEKRPKSTCGKFRVGYHGVVRSQIPEFIALFEAVKELPNVRVDINGGGIDLEKLNELKKKYEGQADIHVNGPYNGAIQSSILYENTDALFCGYGPDDPNYQGDAEVVKFYEAIFTGTPMIMTQAIGMAKKVVKLGFGVVCDTRNSESIKEAIHKLMDDKEFWKQCSMNELANAHKYDWAEAVCVLDEIYR